MHTTSPLSSYMNRGTWRNTIYLLPPQTTQPRAPTPRKYASASELCRSHMGVIRTPTMKKTEEQMKLRMANRDDVQSQITIEDSSLGRLLHAPSTSSLTTRTVYHKNSPFNGLSYLNDQTQVSVEITQGITGGDDTTSPHVGNMRRITTFDDRTIAYTGRVETQEKALEQASFIFFQEMKGSRKGITERVEDGPNCYTLTYIVSSTLNASREADIPLARLDPERKWMLQEKSVLTALCDEEPQTFIDPENGASYQVKLRPILFSDPFNITSKLHDLMPNSLSGSSLHKSIEIKGLGQLEEIVQNRLQLLEEENSAKAEVIQTIYESLRQESDRDCLPEKKILLRDYLYKLLDLPVAYHCKTSTDRTGILIALSSSLQQWIDLHITVPEEMDDLLSDDSFKELFAANLMTGHYLTSYTRSLFGYRFSSGLFQNPVIQRLLPDRFLRSLSWQEKMICHLICLPAHIVLITSAALKVLYNLALRLVDQLRGRTIVSEGPILGPLYNYPLSRIRHWIPDKVIDEDASCVKNHQLLSHLPLPADRPSLEERGGDYPYLVRGKAEVLKQLALDIKRLPLDDERSQLIICGQRYGVPSNARDLSLLANTQAEQLYNQVRELTHTQKPHLSESTLDATTTRVVEKLHQGGLAPLLAKLHLGLKDRSRLLTTPYKWKIELKNDPDDGVILKHQVVMELADEEVREQRQNDRPEAFYEDDLLPRYTDPIHQGEGFVNAYSELWPLEDWGSYDFKRREIK
ncbi:MAG: hypothetical protein NT065_03225 [Chlamydiae bacterium]|nr:hypothetical protein [Chlamydiota bacterium]